MHIFTINSEEIITNQNFEQFKNDEEPCCVVGVIGKTKANENSSKNILHSLHVNPHREFETGYREPLKNLNIDAYYIKEERTIYLSMNSLLNINILNALCQEYADGVDTQSSLKTLEHQHVKALLIIFSICHLILVTHPGSTFDVSYIRLFQLLESLRQLVKPVIREMLSAVSPELPIRWVEAGRPCSPRVLFIFQRCHDNAQASRRTMQLAMEDMIYTIMRKDRVVTDISINSLFAIPANQEFVFMTNDLDHDPLTYFSGVANALSQFTYKDIAPKIKKYSENRPSNKRNNSTTTNTTTTTTTTHKTTNFKSFVMSHINVALTKGFHDSNSRTVSVFPLFELATMTQLLSATNQLHNLIFKRDQSNESRETLIKEIDNVLWENIHLEEQFSENLCNKIYPLAEQFYQNSMPSHYTLKQHLDKLKATMKYFKLNTRGPSVENYCNKLVESSESWWKDGRMACEAVSVMGNHCVYKLHGVPGKDENERRVKRIKEGIKRNRSKTRRQFDDDEDEDDYYNDDDDDDICEDEEEDEEDVMEVMKHTSKYTYKITCDCGNIQIDQADPFDVKMANYTIFQNMRDRCCRKSGMVYAFDMVDDTGKGRKRRKKKAKKVREIVRDEDIEHSEASLASQYLSNPSQPNPRSTRLLGDNQKDKAKINKQQRSQNEQRTDTVSGETPGCKSDDFLMSVNKEGYNDDDDDDEDGGGINDHDEDKNTDDDDDDEDGLKVDRDLYNDYNSILRRHDNDDEYDEDEDEDDEYDLEIKPYDKSMDDGKKVLRRNEEDEEEENDEDGGGDDDDVMFCSANLNTVSYSSWCLMKVGKYDPLRGIHQPNYTHQSNYLLPIVFNSALSSGNNKKHKCHIGLEYECYKGHRFLLASPHKLFKAPVSGFFKETANTLVKKDMPLYFACTCRSGSNYMARLSRIHIVVPENLPYLVRLKVRVRPHPAPCPIFFPEHPSPITLSPGWWTLRMPLAYYDGKQVYSQPSDASLLRHCKLFRDFIVFMHNKA